MEVIDEKFAAYRQRNLGLIGKLIYREELEILDMFPESESATEVIKDLESLARFSGIEQKLVELAQDRLLARDNGELSIIEVCGGSCWLLRGLLSRLKSTGARVNAIGSDLSRRHIAANRKAFKNMDVQWVVDDATALSYSSKQFDLALNCQALHHFSASMVVELLSELNRIARKSLIFDVRRTLYGPFFLKLISPFYSKSFVSDGVISHRRAYSIQEMKYLVQLSGLPYKVTPLTPVGMIVESI